MHTDQKRLWNHRAANTKAAPGQAAQRLDSRSFLLVSGSLVGLAVFLLIYGFTPLDVTNDHWIMEGYDEWDIIQHYAGWCGFRFSSWHFPLGLADTIACGTYISFTDSIPLVAFLFKILLQITGYQGTFQYFGLYTLLCYMLQAIAAGFLISRKTQSRPYIVMAMLLFSFSPVLMERAMRHTALASHWLILFSIYAYFLCKDSQYRAYPVSFYVLSVLAVVIHPYFLPMVMILALITAAEAALKTRRLWYYGRCFCVSLLASVIAGYCIGAIGGGVPLSRGEDGFGYGVFSMNLNALFNPTSKGGYRWSIILPVRPQGWGQYDGFNFLGLGVLVFGALLLLYKLLKAKSSLKELRENAIYLAGALWMFLFAVSSIIVWDDVTIAQIPLPEFLYNLFCTFRASSRMFYMPYYSIFVYLLYELLAFFQTATEKYGIPETLQSPRGEKRLVDIALAVLLLVQLFDLHNVILRKHIWMYRNACAQSIMDEAELAQRTHSYSQMVTDAPGYHLAAFSLKNQVAILFPIANSGTYEEAAAETDRLLSELYKGRPEADTVFVISQENIDKAMAMNPDMLKMEAEILKEPYFFLFPAKTEKPEAGAADAAGPGGDE